MRKSNMNTYLLTQLPLINVQKGIRRWTDVKLVIAKVKTLLVLRKTFLTVSVSCEVQTVS